MEDEMYIVIWSNICRFGYYLAIDSLESQFSTASPFKFDYRALEMGPKAVFDKTCRIHGSAESGSTVVSG